MNKKEQLRLTRAIHAGELDQCWITLIDGREFFALKTVIRPTGVIFHTRHELIDSHVDQILRAVH